MYQQQLQQQGTGTTEGTNGNNTLPMIGGILGGISGLWDIFSNKNNELQRIREREIDEALRQNLQNRQRVLAQSPEAVRRMQSAQMQSGMAGAMSNAANVGAGQAANAGFAGGDVSSAQISGVKSATPVLQSAAPYLQQLSQNYSRAMNQEHMNNQLLTQNTMDRGQLAYMTDYIDRSNTMNPLQNILSMIEGGATVGNNVKTFLK